MVCPYLSYSYKISGILSSNTLSIYPILEFPNFRYSHCLSSRDRLGPELTQPEKDDVT
jgi:hypothetical protein